MALFRRLADLKLRWKLAASAALTIALLAALLGQLALSSGAIDAALVNLDAAGQVATRVNAARATLAMLPALSRDIAAANDADRLADVAREVDRIATTGGDSFDEAGRGSVSDDMRGLLAEAMERVRAYRQAVQATVEMRRAQLAIRTAIAGQKQDWEAALGRLQRVPAFAESVNNNDLRAFMLAADAAVALARAELWRYQTTGEAAAREALPGLANRAVEALTNLMYAAIDPAVQEEIEKLEDIANQMTASAAEIAGATERILAHQDGPVRHAAAALDETLSAIDDAVGRELVAVNASVGEVAAETRGISLGLGAIVIAIVLLNAILIGRQIARPIAQVTAALRRLADGDRSVEIPHAARGDEVGEVARTAGVFKDNLAQMESLRAEQQAAERRAAETRKAELAAVAEGFERAVGAVVDGVGAAAGTLRESAESMAAAAQQTTGQSAAVARAAQHASANVATVASAAEELSASVGEIGRQVADSAAVAREAVSQTEGANARIASLAEAAERIGNVVKLINDIAGQTNLLALNATIEAARAGEAGKGFAVVASEVKSLATQTAKATDEIAGQIAAMQGATGDVVAAIRAVSETIARIDGISGAIAAAVEQQGAATKEIARNVGEAAAGTGEVDAGIRQVTEAADRTGGAAHTVLDAATKLSEQGRSLRDEVARFLATVRAA